MKKGTIVLLVILALIGIGGCQTCGVQKTLVDQDENVKATWAEVENQYQRRFSLIDNLVATVKGYAAHEQSTLTAVIEARAKATQITVNADDLTPEKIEQFQAAQGQLSQALGRLMMVQEQYPDLKADQQFLKLQDELTGTENRIATARGRYNVAVQGYNSYLRKFPTNLLGGMLGFQVKGTFKAEEGASTAPKVQF
ncbi:MAG: LemA family protein [Bacteroidetes bacterium 47-18]|nr:MAG: LemA family protein [Bacteroidetes bacterium 47-18]